MNTRLTRRLFILLAVVTLALAIAPPLAGQDDIYYPAAEWRTSTPEEQGIDSAQLLAALDFIEANNLAIDSLTVIRHGTLVLDAYYHPYTADMPHQLWSATKSFIATLVGIAIDQGLIQGLDQPMLALFPDRTIANQDEHKAALTVGHLLSMASGINCPGVLPEETLLDAPDVLQAILDLGINGAPGGAFAYCNLNSDLLAGALETAAGMPLLDYADQVLFGPLGITDVVWDADLNGLPFGSLGLHLTPHDMARLGYLYLHHGQWAGEQIVSPEWVDTVTCLDPEVCPFDDLSAGVLGYGYHWWLFKPHFYSAQGMAGQYIAVAPEYDMVVVITSSGNTLDQSYGAIPFQLLNQLIVGAVGAEDPLPANPDGMAALEARVEALANPHPQAVPAPPELAAQVSGVTYDLDPALALRAPARLMAQMLGAPMEVVAYSLTFDESAEAVLDLEFIDGVTLALPVGLDGVSRVTETRAGLLAAVGHWTEDGEKFKVGMTFVGGGSLVQLTFRFEEDGVRVAQSEPASGSTQGCTAQPRE